MTHTLAIGPSRPKIHRLPPLRKESRVARLWRAAYGLATTNKVAIVSSLASVLVVSALILHINKLWEGGSFIPQASAHVIPAETGKSTQSIVISGQNGTIVGQIAKIPAQQEKGAPIDTMSNVDNTAQRDLLSVVNKD